MTVCLSRIVTHCPSKARKETLPSPLSTRWISYSYGTAKESPPISLDPVPRPLPPPAMSSLSHDVTYPLFPIAAAFSTVLVLIPLPWHLEAWNSGTCYYMIWTALACFNQFINSVVWANDAINRAPVWCDICG